MFKGISVTNFAYGNTSAGKTYTMFGEDKNEGIIPRTLTDIFKNIN